MRRNVRLVHRGFKSFLAGDSAVGRLAPGGVWMKLAPQAVRGVHLIWRVQSVELRPTHDDRGYDQIVYSVMAVEQSASDAGVAAAADRLIELLTRATFPVEGYRITQCDLWAGDADIIETEADGDRFWQYRGNNWEVWASPIQ